MDASICDRCGSVMKNKPVATLDSGTVMGELDLCETCTIDFRRWAKNEPVNPLTNAMKTGELYD